MFAKKECSALVAAHEKKIPSKLLDTLPLVGSSGHYNFHNKLLRKVGAGTAPSDVAIKSQLDDTLADAKKHADQLFHAHKELVKNDYSNLDTKIEKKLNDTLAVAKKHAEDLFHVHKELVKKDNANLETKIEKKLDKLEARVSSFIDNMIVYHNKLQHEVAVDKENLEKLNERLIRKGITWAKDDI